MVFEYEKDRRIDKSSPHQFIYNCKQGSRTEQERECIKHSLKLISLLDNSFAGHTKLAAKSSYDFLMTMLEAVGSQRHLCKWSTRTNKFGRGLREWLDIHSMAF